MREAFVVDASTGYSWVRPSQLTETAKQLLKDAEQGAAIHVPGLWRLEVANGLLVAVRRRLMTEIERKSGLSFLSRLNLAIDSQADSLAWTTISDLAVTYNLSVYDAAYLELAIRKQLPLTSRDGPLRSAAANAGVEVL